MTKDRWHTIKMELWNDPSFPMPRYAEVLNEIESSLFGGHHKVSALQGWVLKMPLLMQSALISATRGPDTPYVPKVKNMTRWIRGLTFVPGDPANVVEFMSIELPDRIFEHSAVHKQLEATPHHFWSHLILAMEVVGYNHPDAIVKAHAYGLYTDMCFMVPTAPESEAAFFSRLSDRNWPEDAQPRTPEEAFYLIKKHNAFSAHDLRRYRELEME